MTHQKHTEISLIHWFTPHRSKTAEAEPGSRTPARSSMWAARVSHVSCHLLSPTVYFRKKLEFDEDSRLKSMYSEANCKQPKQCRNNCAKCTPQLNYESLWACRDGGGRAQQLWENIALDSNVAFEFFSEILSSMHSCTGKHLNITGCHWRK